MNGVLVCEGESTQKNIGDYIQSVAQEQFFDKTDCYVEREHMDEFVSTERVNVIMNAWWMHHPENFPPSEWINPLFISFHIVPDIAKRLLSPDVISYLKRYEPIGTRDFSTSEILRQVGVDSYFSGCLTLTLGLQYKSKKQGDEVIFVDPYYELGGRKDQAILIRLIKSFGMLIKYYAKVKDLMPHFDTEMRTRLSRIFSKFDKMLHCASFYDSYRNAFEDEVLLNAVYISHSVAQSDFKGNDDKMEYARCLIKRYAKAKFVVTSRIHCALPCLGVETPVLFVNSKALSNSGSVRSIGRFGGLINLFHTLNWRSEGIDVNRGDVHWLFSKGKISSETVFENKRDYRKLRDKMIETVSSFVAQHSSSKESIKSELMLMGG